MPRKRQLPNADEGFLILYHLYRTGIIPRSDLPLCRGSKQDRYAQRLVAKYIKAGYIGTTTYAECEYCFITEEGVIYLRRREDNINHHNPLMDECAAYALGSSSVCPTPEEVRVYLHGDKENLKRIVKKKDEEKGARSEGIKAECDQGSMGTSEKMGHIWEPPVGPPGTSPEKGTPGNLGGLASRKFLLGAEGWEPREREPVKLMHPMVKKKTKSFEEREWSEGFRADIRRNSVENLLYGADIIVYEEDKPNFETFLSILSKPNYTETFLWRLICERGVYYQRRSLNTDSVMYDNRMVGVLFTKAGWYAVYNTLGRFSKWFGTTERKNLEQFMKVMRGTVAYAGCLPASLVFAVGRGMVASMISGYVYGHKRKSVLPTFIKRNRRGEYYMTVEQMKLLYEKVCLVELNSGGIYSLGWLIRSDEDSKTKELQMIASGNPENFRMAQTTGGNPVLIETASGREVILQRTYDLTDLYERRNRPAEVSVIGPPWMADATSKCLNKKLARYISVDDGLDVPFTRYDENGNKITPEKEL